jgi:hypothetical protein
MTQPIEPTPAPEAPAPEATPKVEWTPPASQADLDRIIEERLARERAKFADYDELREKAQLLGRAGERGQVRPSTSAPRTP